MRLIKMLGLAAVAAMATMALVGATSASASFTAALCNTNAHIGDNPGLLACPSGQLSTSVSVVGSGRLLSSLVTVVCDEINATGTPLALASPQQIHVSGLDFSSCETTGGDGCEVNVLEQPLMELLKTGLDSGALWGGWDGETLIFCEDVIFGVDIHCVYGTLGLKFGVGAQHLTASNTQVDMNEGGLCPDESFLDGLLTTNVDPDAGGAGDVRYILA